MNLTDTEIRVLKNIHLKGCMGKCGALNIKQREKLLLGLIEKGLLRENMTLTEKGINESCLH
jgi:hypothetical protein